MRRIGLAFGLAGVCLAAACGQGGGKAPAGKTAPAVAAPAGPHASPGLWRVSMKSEATGDQSNKVCMGADSAMMDKIGGIDPAQCSERRMTRTDHGWTTHAVCGGAGVNSVIDSEISGDPASHLTMKMQLTLSGTGLPQPVTQKVDVDLTREGDCPAGMPPGAVDTGDMIIDSSQMKGK